MKNLHFLNILQIFNKQKKLNNKLSNLNGKKLIKKILFDKLQA